MLLTCTYVPPQGALFPPQTLHFCLVCIFLSSCFLNRHKNKIRPNKPQENKSDTLKSQTYFAMVFPFLTTSGPLISQPLFSPLGSVVCCVLIMHEIFLPFFYFCLFLLLYVDVLKCGKECMEIRAYVRSEFVTHWGFVSL